MKKKLISTISNLIMLFHLANAQSLLDFTVYDNRENAQPIKSIQIDNGLTLRLFEPPFDHGEIKIEEEYYSPFAQVTISFENDFAEFLVDSTVTYIRVTSKGDKKNYKTEYQGNGHFRRVDDSSSNAILSEWMHYKPELSKEFNRIVQTHWGELKTNDSLKSLFKEILIESNERFLHIFQKYPHDYFSFWKFKQIVIFAVNMIPEDKQYLSHLNSFMEKVFPPNFKYTEEGRSISEMLSEDREKLRINDIIPATNLETIRNHQLQIGANAGKLILLDFWATSCPPCVAQLPEINQLFKKYDPKKIDFVGISADHSESTLRSYIERNNYMWSQVYDGKAEISKKFKISVYPTMFLLDQHGKILYIKEGSGNLNELDAIISNYIGL